MIRAPATAVPAEIFERQNVKSGHCARQKDDDFHTPASLRVALGPVCELGKRIWRARVSVSLGNFIFLRILR